MSITQNSRAVRTSPVSDALGSTRGHLVLAFVFSAAVNTLFLASPLYMMQIYGRVLDSRSIETLLSLSFALLLALVAMAGADAVRGRLLARAGARIARRLSGHAAASAMTEGRGEAKRALEDVEMVRRFHAGGAVAVLMDAPFTALFLLVLFLLHPALGFVASFGAVVILATLALARLAESGREARIADGTREIDAMAAGIESDRGEIRALGLLPGLTARIGTEQDSVGAMRLANGEITASVGATTRFVRMAAHSGALATGAVLALNGALSPAAMFAAAILAGRALGPIEALPSAWRQAQAARASLTRLRRRIDDMGILPVEPAATRAGARGVAVEARRLTAAQPNAARPALRGISFSIVAGETVVVAGESGSGKSTLARCLVGAERPKGGVLRIDGEDIAGIEPQALWRRIGWLPQEVPLYPGTIRDNIARFAEASNDAVRNAAERAGARAAISKLPLGFETEVGQAGRNVALGLRQAIGLARALMGSPGLVVLDQPTAHMDAEGEVATINALRRLKSEGVTLVVISHKPVLAALADRIMLLEDGAVELFEDRGKVLDAIRRQSMRPVAASPQTEAPRWSPQQRSVGP